MPRRLTQEQLVRMSRDRRGPRSIEEVLDDAATYSPDVLRAVKAYARSKPWTGTIDERKAKLQTLHDALCRLYDRPIELAMSISPEGETDEASGRFVVRPNLESDLIVIGGRLSVLNYLHYFARALGKTNTQTFKWSVNLFRRCFPRSYANLVAEGPLLRRPGSGTSDGSEYSSDDDGEI